MKEIQWTCIEVKCTHECTYLLAQNIDWPHQHAVMVTEHVPVSGTLEMRRCRSLSVSVYMFVVMSVCLSLTNTFYLHIPITDI